VRPREADDLRHVAASLARVAASVPLSQPDAAVTVAAERRLRGLHVVDLLTASNSWTDFSEPVRRRWLWSRRWHQLQPVDEAAGHVEWFLRRRPDLG